MLAAAVAGRVGYIAPISTRATATLFFALAWSGVLTAQSATSEAAQRAGSRYDGQQQGAGRMNLRVARDGNTLSRFEFEPRMSCTDGRRLSVSVGPIPPGPPVSPEGDLAFIGTQPLTIRRGRRRVSGTARVTVRGSFSASGESAAGTTTSTFTSPTLRCSSGAVPFTVYLDGTRGAPFRGPRVATGRYAMRVRGRGLVFRSALRAFAPASEVTRLLLRSRVRCRSGGSFVGNDEFSGLEIKRGVAAQRRRFNVRRPGVVSRVRSRLVLRFYRRSSSYRVRGTWRVSARVFRGGRLSDTCLLTKRFSGRFRSGPRNLF